MVTSVCRVFFRVKHFGRHNFQIKPRTECWQINLLLISLASCGWQIALEKIILQTFAKNVFSPLMSRTVATCARVFFALVVYLFYTLSILFLFYFFSRVATQKQQVVTKFFFLIRSREVAAEQQENRTSAPYAAYADGLHGRARHIHKKTAVSLYIMDMRWWKKVFQCFLYRYIFYMYEQICIMKNIYEFVVIISGPRFFFVVNSISSRKMAAKQCVYFPRAVLLFSPVSKRKKYVACAHLTNELCTRFKSCARFSDIGVECFAAGVV